MLAAPLLAGNDLSHMTPEIKAILTNRDVIAIDQRRRPGPFQAAVAQRFLLWNRVDVRNAVFLRNMRKRHGLIGCTGAHQEHDEEGRSLERSERLQHHSRGKREAKGNF